MSSESEWNTVYVYIKKIYETMYNYITIYNYIYIQHKYNYIYIDQNKDIWGSYNRRSTANQPRSQRCQSREGSVVCDAILRRESSKHCCISQYLETWREPGTTQAGLTIAEQSRINREPIADFIDIVCKFNWSGLLDFELVVLILLCYWLSLLNTVSRQTRIQYKSV